MASLKLIALDTATPQLRAPATGDTYAATRGLEITPEAGTKALTLTGGTATLTTPVLDATQTWNSPAVNVTGASGDGTTATLTFAAQTTAFPLGSTIVVASVNPSGYNGTFVVTASTTTSVSYASTTTTTYVSGGTVQQVMQGIRFNATDTASQANSRLLDLQVGGASRFNVAKSGNFTAGSYVSGTAGAIVPSSPTGLRIMPVDFSNTKFFFEVGTTAQLRVASDGAIGFSNSFDANAAGNDVSIFRDAADTLAQRRTTNAQTFRVYNTFTDASNYERGKIEWASNVLRIGTEKLGSGTARALEFQTDGTTRLTISDVGRVTFGQTQQEIATVNSFNFIVTGISANPRASFIGTQLIFGSGVSLAWRDNVASNTGTIDTAIIRDGAAGVLAQRSGTTAQESRIYGSYTDATNFQRLSVKTLRESSGALSGGSYVTTIAIPAYAHLVGVTTRVTTAITGATTYDVGDGSDVDLWGAAIPAAAGSQSRTADFTDIAAVGPAAASRTVTLTANGGNFTGGVVEICLHYLTTEAD